MHIIFYDPESSEWVPDLNRYSIEQYNPPYSFIIRRKGEEGSNIVDLEDYNASGSCTCEDYAFRKDPNNNRKHLPTINPQSANSKKSASCKHIRMVRLLVKNGI